MQQPGREEARAARGILVMQSAGTKRNAPLLHKGQYCKPRALAAFVLVAALLCSELSDLWASQHVHQGGTIKQGALYKHIHQKGAYYKTCIGTENKGDKVRGYMELVAKACTWAEQFQSPLGRGSSV